MGGLVYDARAPAEGPAEKPAFRKGKVTALKRAGRWISDAEPARAAAGTVPAQSPVYVGPCRSWESQEVRAGRRADPRIPPSLPLPPLRPPARGDPPVCVVGRGWGGDDPPPPPPPPRR